MGRAILWVLVALIALGVTAGCGGGAVEKAPAGVPGDQHRPLTDLDALEHDLDVSEQRLLASLDQQRAKGAGSPTAAPAAPTGGAAPAPAEAEAAPEPKAEAPADKESALGANESAEQRAGTPCDIACRAFSSMRRSAARICELAGESDGRCARARERVDEAQGRIGKAGCRCLHED